jgi:hypothetical protein
LTENDSVVIPEIDPAVWRKYSPPQAWNFAAIARLPEATGDETVVRVLPQDQSDQPEAQRSSKIGIGATAAATEPTGRDLDSPASPQPADRTDITTQTTAQVRVIRIRELLWEGLLYPDPVP